MTSIRLLAAVLAVAFTGAMAATASAAPWIPGTPSFTTEQDVKAFLAEGFDHPICNGVPRFGHRGKFPHEQFLVFDCVFTMSGIGACSPRIRTVKGVHRDYFRLRFGKLHCVS